MASITTRCVRFFMWLLLTFLVVAALCITGLRILLPKVDQYQPEIHAWVAAETGMALSIGNAEGHWRNNYPSLSLSNVALGLPDTEKTLLNIGQVELQLDLLSSLFSLRPQFADIRIEKLDLDVRELSYNTENRQDTTSLQSLEQLFLVRLGHFSVSDSKIYFRSLAGDEHQLDITSLKWKNINGKHLADGVVGIANSELSQLKVIANFEEQGQLSSINGDFYLQANKIPVVPFLDRYLKEETGIQSGLVSVESWITLKNGLPVDALVQLLPSHIQWLDGERPHKLNIDDGVFKLQPDGDGLFIHSSNLALRTDEQAWPLSNLSLSWQPESWTLNSDQAAIERILPLLSLVPESEGLNNWLTTVAPAGQVQDLRISQSVQQPLRYSANIEHFSMKQWELLPEIHKLNVTLAGDVNSGAAKLNLVDDTLPYGDVFQAPLPIDNGEVSAYWQINDDGWQLWSDKIAVTTPDLNVIGEFFLDFPYESSALLSFYGEADAYHVGETWRYLPTLALGQELTDYLSSAIQGGKAQTAQLVWYGELGDFPYLHNEGVFQAGVGIKQAKFSFDTAWPPLEDLQLDLLFENASMYLESKSARLMDAKATKVDGYVEHLGEGGHLEITASAKAKGSAVRDYMMATPLVDSVGAALTTVQVAGNVTSTFQLDIPFNGDDVRAWGYADLKKNDVEIQTPNIVLEEVSGRVHFDNDVISAKKMTATLLEQPISVNFTGEQQKDYDLAIGVSGNWKVKPFEQYVGDELLKDVSGRSRWDLGLDVQLADIGFTYQVDLKANLQHVTSALPFPLDKPKGEPARARVQASGNQEALSARLTLPQAKYQAEINIVPERPVIEASNIVIGKGDFKVSPIVGHTVQLNHPRFDADSWIEALKGFGSASSGSSSSETFPELPLPERVNIKTQQLELAGLEWHELSVAARKKPAGWNVIIGSQELDGQVSWKEGQPVAIELDKLHLYFSGLEELGEEQLRYHHAPEDSPLISDFDREFKQWIPEFDLSISDAWLQGYKLGKVEAHLRREKDALVWQDISVSSGSNKFELNGRWTLTDRMSRSEFNMSMSGKNNSELMARFGISSGIQKAPFEMTSNLNWDGAPWSMRVDTLSGEMTTRLGSGVISDVSGAARLLGLFSLDSIIRKMKLDFTGVFDDGMPFNSITGSGKMRKGIFVSNNIEMDATAGLMQIKGRANLASRQVDAEVEFTPDLTSGIPVLTAFAVTPQTALYVFAITTALSPVIDVFTQVRYEVKGPLENPEVKEISRSRGEYVLPEANK